MAVEHRNLTGADLHEPKGIDGAASGTVYVADGLGSGSWQAQSGGSGGSANIDDAIVNGATDRAPSQNAVYDALQLKAGVDLTNVSDADFATKAAAAGVGGGGAGVADAINDGVTTVAPSQNAVFDALALKAGTNLSNVSNSDFLSKAGAAGVVEDAIVNGVSTKAPSQNAVFDALGLKADTSHTHAQSDVTGLSTALSGKADTNLSNVSNSDFASKASAAGVGGGGGGSLSAAVLTDFRISGAGGQTLTMGSWTVRTLGMEQSDANGIVSINGTSEEFTLQAGTYLIRCFGTINTSSASVCRSRIYNVTDGAVVAYGPQSGNPSGSYNMTHVTGIVTIASAKNFRWESYLAGSGGITGAAMFLSGIQEVYGQVEIIKLA